MDILSQVGGVSSAVSYPELNPTQSPVNPAQPSNTASSQPANGAAAPLNPELASAPSPTPAEVIASSKTLSPSILYAPSAPPHVGRFDRSA